MVSFQMQAESIQDVNQDPIQHEKKTNGRLSLLVLFLHDKILSNVNHFSFRG